MWTYDEDYRNRKALRMAQARATGLPASERILRAAEDLLDAGDMDYYTVNTIAHDAVVGIGTLNGCFPGGKDAVTRAVADREVEGLLKSIPGPQGFDGASELQAIIHAMVTHGLGRPTLTRSLRAEMLRLSSRYDDEPKLSRLALRVKRCLASREFGQEARNPRAVSEVMTITEGLIDAACERKDRDAAALSARIDAIVFGYLQWNPAVRVVRSIGGAAA